MRDSIFFSYCHRDRKWLDEIQKVLTPGLKGSAIQTWSDKDIKPGMKWKAEIEKALTQAKVAVLLVSPDFLASAFILHNELPPILHAAINQGVTVVWVYVKAAMYRRTDIADFQAAHDTTKPLFNMTPARLSTSLLAICEVILDAYNGIPDREPLQSGVAPPPGVNS